MRNYCCAVQSTLGTNWRPFVCLLHWWTSQIWAHFIIFFFFCNKFSMLLKAVIKHSQLKPYIQCLWMWHWRHRTYGKYVHVCMCIYNSKHHRLTYKTLFIPCDFLAWIWHVLHDICLNLHLNISKDKLTNCKNQVESETTANIFSYTTVGTVSYAVH